MQTNFQNSILVCITFVVRTINAQLQIGCIAFKIRQTAKLFVQTVHILFHLLENSRSLRYYSKTTIKPFSCTQPANHSVQSIVLATVESRAIQKLDNLWRQYQSPAIAKRMSMPISSAICLERFREVCF